MTSHRLELGHHLGFRFTDDIDETTAAICHNDPRPTDIQAHHRQSVRQTFEHDHAAGIVQARKEHDMMRDVELGQLGAPKPGLPINVRRDAKVFRASFCHRAFAEPSPIIVRRASGQAFTRRAKAGMPKCMPFR